MKGSRSTCLFFQRMLKLPCTTKRVHNYLNQLKKSTPEYHIIKFTFWILFWDNLKIISDSCGVESVLIFCFCFLCLSNMSIFLFYTSKDLTNIEGLFLNTLKLQGWNWIKNWYLSIFPVYIFELDIYLNFNII